MILSIATSPLSIVIVAFIPTPSVCSFRSCHVLLCSSLSFSIHIHPTGAFHSSPFCSTGTPILPVNLLCPLGAFVKICHSRLSSCFLSSRVCFPMLSCNVACSVAILLSSATLQMLDLTMLRCSASVSVLSISSSNSSRLRSSAAVAPFPLRVVLARRAACKSAIVLSCSFCTMLLFAPLCCGCPRDFSFA